MVRERRPGRERLPRPECTATLIGDPQSVPPAFDPAFAPERAERVVEPSAGDRVRREDGDLLLGAALRGLCTKIRPSLGNRPIVAVATRSSDSRLAIDSWAT